jgi:type II secretory pathway component PulJ
MMLALSLAVLLLLVGLALLVDVYRTSRRRELENKRIRPVEPDYEEGRIGPE